MPYLAVSKRPPTFDLQCEIHTVWRCSGVHPGRECKTKNDRTQKWCKFQRGLKGKDVNQMGVQQGLRAHEFVN